MELFVLINGYINTLECVLLRNIYRYRTILKQFWLSLMLMMYLAETLVAFSSVASLQGIHQVSLPDIICKLFYLVHSLNDFIPYK